ncbi:MAG TPA: type IV pilus assembly protein PilM [Jatrophihabitans sp.]|nr:type IV pilus assembly protein PilM [Jatrophihabitans sp.]
MKHRQVTMGKVGALNSDGHAIGVDLGAGAVRATVLSPGTMDGRPSVTVHGAGQVELPPGAVVNGVVSDQGAVTRALKELWEKNKFECRSVILGITNQQVVVRDLTLPNLSPEQLAMALPFQAREIVPIPLDQALLDFAPLGEPDLHNETVTGLLIAAPRSPVVAAVEAVERAGLRVARVDLSSFALLRSIAGDDRSVEAVIDIGAHLTNIVIHNHGIPKVVRAVTRGGSELTEMLVSKAGLDTETAEAAKCEIGLTGPDPRVADAMNQAVRPLLAEIRSSIQYFGSTNAGARIERISLTGGGARLRGLAELLAQQVDAPTRVVSPTQHIRNRLLPSGQPDGHTETAATAVSVGLAMGAAA